MYIFHINKDFTPFKGRVIDINLFPSGVEEKVKLNDSDGRSEPYERDSRYSVDNLRVMLTYAPTQGIGPLNIAFAIDAIKRAYPTRPILFSLFMPYLPYARQDRIMTDGEAFTLKVFCNFINTLDLFKVYVFDAHSDIGPALLNNCVNIPNYPLVDKALFDILFKNVDSSEETIIKTKTLDKYKLVSPDAGSLKKIYKLAKHLNYTSDIIKADKIRNTATGDIERIDVTATDFQGDKDTDLIVVDDICSYGGTFLGLAKSLREKFEYRGLYLIVSHIEPVAKLRELFEYYDHIYSTKSLPSELTNSMVITFEEFDINWIKG